MFTTGVMLSRETIRPEPVPSKLNRHPLQVSWVLAPDADDDQRRVNGGMISALSLPPPRLPLRLSFPEYGGPKNQGNTSTGKVSVQRLGMTTQSFREVRVGDIQKPRDVSS